VVRRYRYRWWTHLLPQLLFGCHAPVTPIKWVSACREQVNVEVSHYYNINDSDQHHLPVTSRRCSVLGFQSKLICGPVWHLACFSNDLLDVLPQRNHETHGPTAIDILLTAAQAQQWELAKPACCPPGYPLAAL